MVQLGVSIVMVPGLLSMYSDLGMASDAWKVAWISVSRRMRGHGAGIHHGVITDGADRE
jgi:hypothetical protein